MMICSSVILYTRRCSSVMRRDSNATRPITLEFPFEWFGLADSFEWCFGSFAQKLLVMRRSSDLVRNRLRQQAGNLSEKTRSLARPVPYRVRLIEFFGQSL